MLPLAAEAQVPAENYQLFRVDSTLSVPFAHGPGSWGVGAAVEPKFNLLDFLAVGIRAEGALLFGGDFSAPSSALSVDMRGVVAFLAKADLYLTTAAVRPFVGFGMGLYHIASQSVSTGDPGTSIDQSVGSHFGIAPQVGINLGPFRLAATYNVIVGGDVVVRQTVTVGQPPGESSTSQNYFSFEIGGTFGGRRREPAPDPAAEPLPAVPTHSPPVAPNGTEPLPPPME